MQQEMTRLLEERKKLIEGAARQSSVDVKDANEWAFDNEGTTLSPGSHRSLVLRPSQEAQPRITDATFRR